MRLGFRLYLWQDNTSFGKPNLLRLISIKKNLFDMIYFLKSFMGILLFDGYNSFAANQYLMLGGRGGEYSEDDGRA